MRSQHRFRLPLSLLALWASRAVAQGSAACAAIEASLGAAKVFYSPDPTFVYESQHFYDARNADNVPACVVEPADAADVSECISAVRAANSTFGIKSGGHNGNGDKQWSSTAGGVLIDLINLDQVVYNTASGTVLLGGGQRYTNVYEQLQDTDITVVGARLPDLGVGGWNLGGGLSYLSAQWGLGVDNYQSLEVVIPDGTIVNATASNEYSDLFFALKGGGNQFGIVTTFESTAHEIGQFTSGLRTYTGDQAPALVNAAAAFAANYTDEKAAIILTLDDFVGLPVALLFLVYDGPVVPPGTFEMFEVIPALLDTTSVKSYYDTINMVPFENYGPRQVFWSVPISIDRATEAYDAWTALEAQLAPFESITMSLDYQPIPRSLVEYGTAQGGNPIFAGDEGPFIWLNLLVDWLLPSLDDMIMAAAYNWTQTVGAQPGISLFFNDADWMQDAVKTYAHYDTLVQTKQKYDPDGWWTAHVGGPSYSS